MYPCFSIGFPYFITLLDATDWGYRSNITPWPPGPKNHLTHSEVVNWRLIWLSPNIPNPLANHHPMIPGNPWGRRGEGRYSHSVHGDIQSEVIYVQLLCTPVSWGFIVPPLTCSTSSCITFPLIISHISVIFPLIFPLDFNHIPMENSTIMD